MKTMQYVTLFLVLLFVAPFVVPNTFAQQVVVIPDERAALSEKIDWALESSRKHTNQGFFVGYQISKFMHKDSWIGRFGGEGWGDRKSLYALLGKEHLEVELPEELQGEMSFSGYGTFHIETHNQDGELYLRDLGILFHYFSPNSAPNEVLISSMSLGVEIEDQTLFWVGKSNDSESIDYLRGLFNRVKDEDLKSDLLRVAGNHEGSEAKFDFLSEVLASNESEDIREEAVFGIGQLDLAKGLNLLKNIVANDESIEIREKAVFSISHMSLPEAQDVLIDLAKNERNRDVRKQAIFWLGQQASKNASKVLEAMVFDDEDTQVQEYAVHALAQMETDESISKLIEIATEHPNVSVRKKAIFWLGDSGDPRALDVLIELAQRGR